MINNNVAIIPARKGSKGIPKKNVIDINGKPLIAYTIEAAIESKSFEKICIASDFSEVETIANEYNIETISLPNNLTKDNSMMIDVLLYVLDIFNKRNEIYQVSTLLQPTSPLRNSYYIKKAIDTFDFSNYRSLVSFSEVKEHPYKSFYWMKGNQILSLFGDKYLSTPRQLLPKIIKQNGAIYINKIEDLFKFKTFFIKPVYPFIMDSISSIDIDTRIDLFFVKYYLSNNLHKNEE